MVGIGTEEEKRFLWYSSKALYPTLYSSFCLNQNVLDAWGFKVSQDGTYSPDVTLPCAHESTAKYRFCCEMSGYSTKNKRCFPTLCTV